MNVIQVVNVRWFNACAWYGLYLARLLQEAGHRVLACGLEGTDPQRQARDWNIPWHSMELNSSNPLAMARAYRGMGGLVEDFRPDVVDCHRGEGFILWGLLRKRRGNFRLVRTRGDQRPPRADPVNRWLHNVAADGVVATNSAMAVRIRTTLGTPEHRVRCIPGGVDADAYAFDAPGRERVRAEFGFGPDDFVVGLLGRLDPVKGQREAVRAVARLRKEHGMGRLRLLLLGAEAVSTEAEVRAWIREHGMEDAARITGRRPDLAACLSACDLGLVASQGSEAIARAGLEIMACGRPLVSTDVGVMPDLLPAEALAPPGNEEALMALIGRVAKDAPFRESLAADHAARLSGLTGRAFLAQTLELYECICRA